MSKFSGKCDLYDWFGRIAGNEGETPYECFKRLNARIFMGERTYQYEVKIERPSDLVMFYPFADYLHVGTAEDVVKDDHYINRSSFISDTFGCNPEFAARELQDLLDEYWRVKEEEDPKYVM